MEIRQLRYFIAVADTLNFSRAAESVYLSQSALSRQIMDLEKEVGLPLLRRSTRQVELTEAGKALKKSAKELISRWEKMLPEDTQSVAEEAQALSLTIGVDARALSNPERRRNFLSVLYDLRPELSGAAGAGTKPGLSGTYEGAERRNFGLRAGTGSGAGAEK